jgi:hypothetical protein
VLKADGSAWCAGYNVYYKLTHDAGASSISVLTPVLFDADQMGAIAVGLYAACFVSATTGETKCAGLGAFGELGDGLTTSTTDRMVIAKGLNAGACSTTGSLRASIKKRLDSK